jgi:hypothetical protein
MKPMHIARYNARITLYNLEKLLYNARNSWASASLLEHAVRNFWKKIIGNEMEGRH